MDKTECMILPKRAPVVDSARATFYWQGEAPSALAGDFNGWDFANGPRMMAVSAGVWKAELDLPADTYMEYAFLLNGQRVLDPLNPCRVNNGTGDYNNYFYMPGTRPSEFARRRPRRGRLTEYRVEDDIRLLDSHRKIYLYQPDAEGPYPLVVVYDGLDYLKRGRITCMVDSLIRAGKIQPVALALVPNARAARFVEYAANDSTVSFILNKVIPLAQQNLPLVDVEANPGAFCVAGASMGGMMALYSALRAPRIFGKVICQSGAFSMYGEDFSIFDLVDYGQLSSLRVWMDIGRFDFLYSINQRMHGLLKSKGCDVAYHEVNGGHNYTTWRDDLPNGLEYFFPVDPGSK